MSVPALRLWNAATRAFRAAQRPWLDARDLAEAVGRTEAWTRTSAAWRAQTGLSTPYATGWGS